MKTNTYVKSLVCASTFFLVSATANADSYQVTTYSTDGGSTYTYINDVLLGLGAAALIGGGVYLALHYKHHHDESAGPLCDSYCQDDIYTAMKRYQEKYNIPVMQMSFKTSHEEYGLEVSTQYGKHLQSNNGLQYKFYAGTINRLFTTKAILDLEASNRLKLSDTISTYFAHTYPAWEQKQIKQLLKMTSGIYNYASSDNTTFWDSVRLNPTTTRVDGDLIAFAQQKTTNYPWEDSFTNDILQEMIIGTLNINYDDLVNNIINKQGLTNTRYTPTLDSSLWQLVSGYDKLHGTNTLLLSPSVYRASGALFSNTADITQLMWALFDTSDKGLLNATQRNELLGSMICMGSPQANCIAGTPLPTDSPDFGYFGGVYRFGLNQIGLSSTDKIYYVAGESFGHTMGTYYYPEKDIVITLAGNTRTDYNVPAYQDLYRQILDILYSQDNRAKINTPNQKI